jgi:hypothetical protein
MRTHARPRDGDGVSKKRPPTPTPHIRALKWEPTHLPEPMCRGLKLGLKPRSNPPTATLRRYIRLRLTLSRLLLNCKFLPDVALLSLLPRFPLGGLAKRCFGRRATGANEMGRGACARRERKQLVRAGLNLDQLHTAAAATATEDHGRKGERAKAFWGRSSDTGKKVTTTGDYRYY